MATVLAKRASVKPTHARSANSARGQVRREPATALSPTALHALAVAGRHASNGSRDKLKPGIYEVNETVQIVGTLTVGRDSESNVSIKPDLVELLALAIDLVPVRERNVLIDRLLDRANKMGDDPLPEASKTSFTNARMLVECFTRTGTQKRRGTVTGDFAIHAQ